MKIGVAPAFGQLHFVRADFLHAAVLADLSALGPATPVAIFDFMGHANLQQRRYTAGEYFALEENSEVRHEFSEGEIFAMAGASITHNTIAGNLYMALRQGLRGKQCRVQMEAVRLVVEENRHYTYPDVLVSCDSHDQRESQQLHSPILIVEVLSPSTEAYDRGLKFNQYKKLPSLRHYLLVSQQTWLVEWYQLTEHGVWAHTALAEADDTLVIPELNLTLTLTGIYDETDVVPMRIDFKQESQ